MTEQFKRFLLETAIQLCKEGWSSGDENVGLGEDVFDIELAYNKLVDVISNEIGTCRIEDVLGELTGNVDQNLEVKEVFSGVVYNNDNLGEVKDFLEHNGGEFIAELEGCIFFQQNGVPIKVHIGDLLVVSSNYYTIAVLNPMDVPKYPRIYAEFANLLKK